MKLFRADLHIHTVLSPCTELAEMNPRAIVTQAVSKNLDLIAICDHNSAANVEAVMHAAESSPLEVLPGMEITSREEVHIVALFPSLERDLEMQEIVYAHLPDTDDKSMVSYQIETDVENYVLNFNCKLLLGATDLSVEQVVERVHRLEGLAIAAHVDREANSIIGQLGFIPPGLPLDALEVSYRMSLEAAQKNIPAARDYPLITSSDAHYLEDIGKVYTSLTLKEPSLAEIRKAFSADSGRRITT